MFIINPWCMCEGYVSHFVCAYVCYQPSCYIPRLYIENKVLLSFSVILWMYYVDFIKNALFFLTDFNGQNRQQWLLFKMTSVQV